MLREHDTSRASAERFLRSYQRKIDDRNAKQWGYQCASRMCLEHTVLMCITPHPETSKTIWHSVVDQYGPLSESYFLVVLRSLRDKGLVTRLHRGNRRVPVVMRDESGIYYRRTQGGTKKLRRLGILP